MKQEGSGTRREEKKEREGEESESRENAAQGVETRVRGLARGLGTDHNPGVNPLTQALTPCSARRREGAAARQREDREKVGNVCKVNNRRLQGSLEHHVSGGLRRGGSSGGKGSVEGGRLELSESEVDLGGQTTGAVNGQRRDSRHGVGRRQLEVGAGDIRKEEV